MEMLAAAAADGLAGSATFAERGSGVGRTFHRNPLPEFERRLFNQLRSTSNEHTSTAYSLDRGIRSKAMRCPNPTIRPVSPNMKTTHLHSWRAAVLAILLAPCAYSQAQTTSAPPAAPPAPDDELVVLSPFEVKAASDPQSYNAATTLAGNRLNTDLRDVGSSVTVITSQFLRDTGATNNASLLQSIGGAEVSGVYGNFAGSGSSSSNSILAEDDARPNENTRIRGLAAADNTRDFFRTEIPWDSYNTDRLDIQRGPNSILFGQGSPAGIINAGTKGASFHNSGEVEARYGSYGSARVSLDINHVLVPGQVAFRLDALRDDEKYEQKPAYSKDQRLSGAIRIEPEFLKKNGNRTIFKANFESGQIDSNNPRQLPPMDHITPWLTPGSQAYQVGLNGLASWVNGGTVPASTAANDYTSAARPNANSALPAYNPYFTNGQFLNDNFPLAVFQQGSTQGATGTYRFPYVAQTGTPSGFNFYNPTTIGGFPGSWVSLNGASNVAVFNQADYSNAGAFKDVAITDPSVFNSYKHLIDGNTKKEWQRFWSGSANLTQTFLDDQVGFSLDYNKEHFEVGQINMFGGSVPLYVDVMKTNNDGTSPATATLNPNYGTPFVVNHNYPTNNSWISDRENKRATAFVTHDFRKDISGLLGQIIGTHTLTGLAAEDEQNTSAMGWQRYGYLGGAQALATSIYATTAASQNLNFLSLAPQEVIYLGGSLVGKPLSGVNIPGITGNPTIGSNSISYFSFAPNPANPPGATSSPANYVGWTSSPLLTVTDSEASAANRQALATSAGLTRSLTTSQALVWQGKLLDGALVGTYGWRKDINKSWASNANINDANDPNNINFNALKLNSNPDGRVEVQSRSYSIVAHLGDLPGLKGLAKNLPVNVSLSYNVSTNFKPDSSRVNVNGDAIGAPSGKTIDRGILIETRDGKYSLKVNRYKTSIANGSNPNGQSFAQSLIKFVGWTAYYNNVFYYRTNQDGGKPEGADGNPGIGSGPGPVGQNGTPNGSGGAGYFFQADPVTGVQYHTAAVDALQIASTQAVRAWETQINTDFPNFFKQWNLTSLAATQSGLLGRGNMQNAAPETGFAITEDTVSKGWEIELNANPTKNWRITLNATRTDAVRTALGDPALAKFVAETTNMVQNTAGGAQHWFWGTSDVPTLKQTYYISYGDAFAELGTFYSELQAQQGIAVPELAKWRFNLAQNYDFTHGPLNNFNIGGGVRYSSATIIGYPLAGDPKSPPPYLPVVSMPYYGPSELYVDLWVGYHHKLTNKINWNIQLNVENVGKKDSLIPVSLQGPQGPIGGPYTYSPAAYRIAPAQKFTLTTRFEF